MRPIYPNVDMAGALVALYRLTLGTSNLQPRYNICPTTQIDAVVSMNGARELVR